MSIPNTNLIHDIWSRSGTDVDFASIATMHRPFTDGNSRGRWKDHLFRPGIDTWPIIEQPHQHDLFFSVLRFELPERSNENVSRPGVLFADLDPVDPRGLDPELHPTAAWETSPGNYQAVWFLDTNRLDYEVWRMLNKRMTHYTGADVGGWQGSKVLRVPGSVNWKRRAFGELLWYHPEKVFSAQNLDGYLPHLPTDQVTMIDEDHPMPPTYAESTRIIRREWRRISLRGRNMLMRDRVQDRSLHIVRTLNELLSSGIAPDTVFHMIWQRPWNKWRTDRDQPSILWQEIVRARGVDL